MSSHPIQRSGQLLTVLMAGAAAVSVLAVPVSVLAVPEGAIANECGYCVDGEDPFNGNDIHQFQVNEQQDPNFECLTGEPGHPLHSCDEGDGSTWVQGVCGEEHDECSGGASFAAGVRAAVGDRIPARHAAELAASHPDRVTYDTSSHWVFFRDCDGGVGAMMPAQHPDGALGESSEDPVALLGS